MPELPEMETVRRGLERETVGRRIKSAAVDPAKLVRRNGTKKSFQSRVEGTKIKGFNRRGGLLVSNLDSGDVLVFSLGPSGRLARTTAKDETEDGTRLVVTFTQGGQLRLVDPDSEAEVFVLEPDQLVGELPEVADLGLDPVADSVSWTSFAHALIARKSGKLKPLLLDSSFVVGLGDVYADEIAYDAGLRPERDVSTLSTMEIRRLYRALVEKMHEATKHRGTSTTSHPFVDIHGKPGNFQEELQVWERTGKACARCRGTISKGRVGNRTTYFCPSCQT